MRVIAFVNPACYSETSYRMHACLQGCFVLSATHDIIGIRKHGEGQDDRNGDSRDSLMAPPPLASSPEEDRTHTAQQTK